MDRLPITYIDSSVLIAYIYEPQADDEYHTKQHESAKRFFDEIKAGRQLGILSDLALMEVLGVFRKDRTKELEELKKMPSWKQQLTFIVEGAKNVYEGLMTEMLKIPQVKFMRPLTADVTELLSSASDILYDMRGRVKFYDSCDKCCTRKEGEQFVCTHKCVGAMDVLHAVIANELNCTKLATFDKGFHELKSEYRLHPLEIDVLRIESEAAQQS